MRSILFLISILTFSCTNNNRSISTILSSHDSILVAENFDPEPNFNYSFPTIIDWVDGSYRIELEKKLKSIYKNKAEVAKKVLVLFKQAVGENLKQLGT